jgi:hypothetical protein
MATAEERPTVMARTRYFRRASRWALKTTRNIWMQSQKTPLMQAAVRPPQSRIIFGSVEGTCGLTALYRPMKNRITRIASTAMLAEWWTFDRAEP